MVNGKNIYQCISTDTACLLIKKITDCAMNSNFKTKEGPEAHFTVATLLSVVWNQVSET